MVGANTDEWRLFLVPGGAIDQITAEILAGAVAAYGLPVEAALAAYRAAHPGASAGDLLAAIQSDWYFRIPAIRLADAHATSPAATYMYEFAWRSPQFDGRLGACHGARDRLRLRHARQRDRAARGSRPSAAARRHHARRLGGVRHQWGPRLAEVRPQPPGHHALRHDLGGRGRSSIGGAGAVGRRAVERAWRRAMLRTGG